MNHKNNKIVKLTALAGGFAAIAAGIVAIFTHFKKKQTQMQESASDNTQDNDINELDIASINNGTPRQYVSISINAHNDGENLKSK